MALRKHKVGSKTRAETMKTAARANYNKRRGIAGDKYVNPKKAKASAAPASSPAPKARPAAKKSSAPTSSPAPKARVGKASTGGPARHKTSKASTGGPARYKSSAKPAAAKKSDPPTQGKRIRDKVKSFFKGDGKPKAKRQNPRDIIGARNDKKK